MAPDQLGVCLCPPALPCHLSTSALTPRSLNSQLWAEQVNVKAKGKEGPSYISVPPGGLCFLLLCGGSTLPRRRARLQTQETLGWGVTLITSSSAEAERGRLRGPGSTWGCSCYPSWAGQVGGLETGPRSVNQQIPQASSCPAPGQAGACS